MNNKILRYATHIAFQSVCLASLMTSAYAQQHSKYIPDGYSIQTLDTPKDLPFHVTGLDVNSKGQIVIATRLGDVWLLDEIIKKDGQLAYTWSKFADGLTEPTGLMVDKDDSIIVAHKPELTRLIDTDKDGVADEYINLASDWVYHDNYHEFNFGPVKDKQGNLYGTLNLGHGNPGAFSIGAMDSAGGYRGWAYKVTTDGKFIPYASGLRSPAGIGISPQDDIFFTDNQGDWVPTSKLHLLKEDKFYGHPVSLRDKEGYTPDIIRKMSFEELEAMSEKPVVWIPHEEIANSPGNPVWDVSGGHFGPFEGQIFIGDQTQSNVFRVLLEKVNGEHQGAVLNFASGFKSGNIRLNFDKKGQLWVGQTARGWYAKGGKPFGVEKLVWDGKTTPFELLDVNIKKNGFKLSFTEALAPDSAILSSFAAQQWHYYYSSNYGSEKIDLAPVTIEKVSLSKDRKSIELTMPITAGKVVQIDFDGLSSISNRHTSVATLYYTVNNAPSH